MVRRLGTTVSRWWRARGSACSKATQFVCMVALPACVHGRASREAATAVVNEVFLAAPDEGSPKVSCTVQFWRSGRMFVSVRVQNAGTGNIFLADDPSAQLAEFGRGQSVLFGPNNEGESFASWDTGTSVPPGGELTYQDLIYLPRENVWTPLNCRAYYKDSDGVVHFAASEGFTVRTVVVSIDDLSPHWTQAVPELPAPDK